MTGVGAATSAVVGRRRAHKGARGARRSGGKGEEIGEGRPVTISRRTNDRCPGARDDLAPARPVVVMSLSPREQDILENIESQLLGEDPALAQRLTEALRQKPARPRPWMLLLAVLSILGGIGLMILAAISANLILMVAGISFSVIVPTLTISSYLLGRSQSS